MSTDEASSSKRTVVNQMRFFLAFLLLVSPVFSANWYVRKGASGSNNGTSWTNAWNELSSINSSSVACGDTVWLAGGTYTTNLTVSKNCTSSSQLTIQSVLSSDSVPTSAAGYTAAVLNQVVVQDASFVTSSGAYITISGRHGIIGTEGTFGIVIQCSTNCDTITVTSSGATSNITLTEMELYGPPCVTSGGNGEGSCAGDTHGVDHGPYASTNLTIDHMWMHRFGEIVRPYQWTNYVVQYCDLDTTRETPDEHEDIMYAANPSSGTMRYNVIWGSPNDGIFFDFGGNSLTFYGNVVFHSGGGILTFKPGYSGNSLIMYNNTFSSDETFGDYICPNNCPWIDLSGVDSGGATSVAENNIFDHVAFSGSPTSADYNAYSSDIGKNDNGAHSFTYTSAFAAANTQFMSVNTSNPVVSNYQLTASGVTTFQKGVALSSPYNLDANGNARGASGSWTIGAYQYGTGTPPLAPNPPTLLTVVVN